MPSCDACSASVPDDARFCPACGAPLGRRDEDERRVVTVLLSDVVDSTGLAERVDAETLGAVMTRFYDVMRRVLERHGGTVEKFIGDAVVATFGLPRIHEDDPVRAVRAALEMCRVLDDLNGELASAYGLQLEIRTGIASGEVVIGAGPAVLGSPANLAARLQGEAGIGQILLGPTTERLVRGLARVEPAGRLVLKGFPEPVEAFRLLSLPSEGARGARDRVPLVGRDDELSLLELAFRRVERARAAQLVTVFGDAGIGKTRLVEELVSRVAGSATVLRGRCLPYGEGITFFPVAEAVGTAAGLELSEPADRAREKVGAALAEAPRDETTARVVGLVAEAIGLGGTAAAPEETLWAIRRYFELLAAAGPVVLVFDDLQWAEPTFLDLLTQIAERSRQAPILVTSMARPEFRELRPAWGSGAANSVTVSLDPLGVDDGARLARATLGEGEIDESVVTAVAEVAGGNPLFLEEYVAMLVDGGVLRRDDDTWVLTRDLSQASTPPTLAGLLAAKLERLGTHERELLTHASVIGKAFTFEELSDLLPRPSDVSATVASLVDQGLLRSTPSAGAEFQHQLLRDAAYDSLPKARRAELHERFADRLEAPGRERPEDLDAIIGFHLSRSHGYRIELALDDDRTRGLASRAADRLASAGRRALERGDPPAATRLLRRAAELAADPGMRGAIRLRLSAALADAGASEDARATLELGHEDAVTAGDIGLRTRCEHRLTTRSFVLDPEGAGLAETRATIEGQLATFRTLGDEEGVAECLYQLATLGWVEGRASDFERFAREGLASAEICGSPRLVGRTLSYVASAIARGPTPLARGVDEVQALLERELISQAEAALVRFDVAEMLAWLGRFDEAHGLMDASYAALEELGHSVGLRTAESALGVIARLEGDLDAAEGALRRSYGFFRETDDLLNAAIVGVDLAGIVNDRGCHQEALELTETVERLAATFDVESQIGWRVERARSLAALGRTAEATEVVDDALVRAARTDVVPLKASVESAAGDVAAAADRRDAARMHWRSALELWATKGAVVGTGRAEARLAELESPQPS